MNKIDSNEIWENFSFAVRDDRNGETSYVKIKDFLGDLEVY